MVFLNLSGFGVVAGRGWQGMRVAPEGTRNEGPEGNRGLKMEGGARPYTRCLRKHTKHNTT